MTTRFLVTLVSIVLCVPCFAEEMPSVPELIKKMYDYRMAIENMRAEVTVTYPADTRQPIKEKVKQRYYFAYDKGRVRCDMTHNINNPESHFDQYLSTPDFYFERYNSPPPPPHPPINEGNSLFLNPPLDKPFDTLDPRRIGTDPWFFDTMTVYRFNYDTLLERFYSPMGENYVVSIDNVDGERLYKVSFQVSKTGSVCSFWVDPQKGYNLVRREAGSEKHDFRENYIVTLKKFTFSGREIWFPQQVVFKRKSKDNVSEERIVLDSVDFDAKDETPFTLAGLNIPIGYRVLYHGKIKYWDGKELVDKIPYVFEPVSMKDRKIFWIVNGIGFALIALVILYRWISAYSELVWTTVRHFRDGGNL